MFVQLKTDNYFIILGRNLVNNLGEVDPAVRRKVSHSIYTCFCLGYGMRSGIPCKAFYRTADAARA